MLVKSPIFTWVAVLLWFASCSALVIWIGSANKSAFDPSSKLAMAIMDLGFESALISAVSAPVAYGRKVESFDSAGGKIFHITQGECFCEWLAQPHKNNLDKWSTQNAFSSYKVNLKQHPNLREFIPSTPAVLAVDEHGNLIYFGPYSRGSGCFASSGIIDERLKEWQTQQLGNISPLLQNEMNLGAMIDTDASGCYCQT